VPAGKTADVTGWTCPECGRRFLRRGQGHECSPAMSLDDYLATAPPHEPPVVEVVLDHLATLGDDVHIEPVSVGILVKRAQSFAELRPMTRWEALMFKLPRRVESRRIARKPVGQGGLLWHVVNLRTPDEFDEDVRGWLTEAYLAAPE
jgi:Domain of unknown function (DUF5655)